MLFLFHFDGTLKIVFNSFFLFFRNKYINGHKYIINLYYVFFFFLDMYVYTLIVINIAKSTPKKLIMVLNFKNTRLGITKDNCCRDAET